MPTETENPAQRKRLLVVDDSEDIRRLASHFLAKTFPEPILTAENGRAALDILNRCQIDLVFMDLQMPLMDGFEAVRSIKDDPRTRSLPIIALTAHTSRREIGRAIEAGYDGCVFKPFSRDDLTRAVMRHTSAGTLGSETIDQLMPRLRESYRQKRVHDAQALPTLISNGNWFHVAKIAAVTEKTARGYGLAGLAAIAARLAEAARNRDESATLQLSSELATELDPNRPDPLD